MKISMNKAKEILTDLKANGEVIYEDVKITNTITKSVYIMNGWEYVLIFESGVLKKIEEGNHRELIEAYVEN